MRFFHLIQRSKNFSFVCRVPVDLQHHFPCRTIWISLKTSNKRHAQTLAAVLERNTQLLFTQLRSKMLEPELEKFLISRYLKPDYEIADTDLTSRKVSSKEAKNIIKQNHDDMTNCPAEHKIAMLTEEIELIKQQIQQKIPHGATSKIVAECKAEFGVPITKQEFQTLGIMLQHSFKEFCEAYLQGLNGNMTSFLNQKDNIFEAAKKEYMTFGMLVDKYIEWYRKEKPNLKTFDSDTVPRAEALKEMIGENTSIYEANTSDCINKLKGILVKYPTNKNKIFKGIKLTEILRSENDYDIISTETANKYINMIASIIDYAIDELDYDIGANKARHKTFTDNNTLASDKRDEYTEEEIHKLIDAICTKSFGSTVIVDDRFWIVLIGLFHGFRLGNIVNLTKQHIDVDKDGRHCFNFKEYRPDQAKNSSTRTIYTPIDPILIQIGFLEWVDTLKRHGLFTDSSDKFSKFYNRDEKKKVLVDGELVKKTVAQGFEPRYVTDEPGKCFYSTRHTFINVACAANIDDRITKAMSGHAQNSKDIHNSVYLKQIKTKTIATNQEKLNDEFIQVIGIDVARLRNRAIELFNINPPELK